MIVHQCVGARVGLMGNPSDGFGGKTIAALLQDFYASMTLWESPKLEIIPHLYYDPFCFDSIDHLARVAEDDGYYGGVRLLYATVKRFHTCCQERGIHLDGRNFTLEYDTNVPRQVGLAGSSAIITAALKCLMGFYGLTDADIPREIQPQIVLEVETKELGIQAGLQDRVVQVYGGLVYMDFDPEIMAAQGYGNYESLDVSKLPPLYVAYVPRSTECSGKLHTNMRYRFENGDPEVIAGMKQFARYADLARVAIEEEDHQALGELMNANFDLRRRLYGDEALGRHNLEMIEIARRAGLPAKFPGSGGAIVGIYDDPARLEYASKAFRQAGYEVQPVTPTECVPTEWATGDEQYVPTHAVAGAFHTAARNAQHNGLLVAK
ncbi:MAG: mevalonate kinase [Armatimonadota bacterium]